MHDICKHKASFSSSPSGTSPSPSSTGLEPLVEDREVEEPWDPCRERNRVESRTERALLLICGITQNSLQSIITIKKTPDKHNHSPFCYSPSQNKYVCSKIDKGTLCNPPYPHNSPTAVAVFAHLSDVMPCAVTILCS